MALSNMLLLIFSRETYQDISCESSAKKTIHIKCQALFPYKYSWLSWSRNPRDSLKHFEISVLRHIRFAELRKTINPTTTFNSMNLKIDSQVREQFLLFSTIFCYLLVDLCFKIGTRFLLRDKRLFEITRVDCSRKWVVCCCCDWCWCF